MLLLLPLGSFGELSLDLGGSLCPHLTCLYDRDISKCKESKRGGTTYNDTDVLMFHFD
jgi:hypothetical protein